MKQGKKSLVSIAQLACIITIAAGCSATLAKQGDSSAVTVDIQRSSQFVISGVSVSQQEGVISVRGRVRRRRLGPPVFVVPHLDIEVTDAGGTIQMGADVPFRPLHIPRKPGNHASFVANIPGKLPAEAVIRLRYHRGKHDGNESRLRGLMQSVQSLVER